MVFLRKASAALQPLDHQVDVSCMQNVVKLAQYYYLGSLCA